LSKFREKRQPQGIATTLVKIARIDERQGHLQQAHTSLKEAVALFAKASDRSAHAESLLAIGRVSAQLGLSDESRDALTQAAALFTRVRNARGWNDTMVQLGLLQIAQGENSAGLTTLQQAAEEARTRRHVDQQFTATVALGDAHWLLGHTSDARSAYLDALNLAEAEHHLPFEGMMQLRLARLDGDKASLNDRVAQGKRALQIAQAVHDTAAEAEAGRSWPISMGNWGKPRSLRMRTPMRWRSTATASCPCTGTGSPSDGSGRTPGDARPDQQQQRR
jgi:tetratricopeptide (TPR) repeat protein